MRVFIFIKNIVISIISTTTTAFIIMSGITAVALEKSTPIYAEACPFGCPVAIDGNNISVVIHTNYISAIDHKTKLSRWVAYPVQQKNFGTRPKTSFTTDPLLPLQIQLSPQAYEGMHKKHNIDRGHLAPAVTISIEKGTKNGIQSFYMSNILPQPKSLNRRAWKMIEGIERKKKGYVIAGAISYTTDYGTLLPSTNFWKVYVPNTKNKTFSAIIFEKKKHSINKSPVAYCYRNLPIKKLQKITGLQFFNAYTLEQKDLNWKGQCIK